MTKSMNKTLGNIDQTDWALGERRDSLFLRMKNENNLKAAGSQGRVLLVDGQEQLPLVHADSGVVSLS